jgi:hypothetical protein
MSGNSALMRLPASGTVAARLAAIPVVLLLGIVLTAASVHAPWWYLWRVWGVGVTAAVAGAAVAWAARPAARPVRPGSVAALDRRAAVPVAPRPPSASALPATDGGALVGERRRLATALIDLLDQVPSESLRYRVRRALSDAGIAEYGADGQPFDPARHQVVDVRLTDDPSQERRVARTLRPGFSDGEAVLRPADVLVYRRQASRTDGVSG